jgi:hypothetical protein
MHRRFICDDCRTKWFVKEDAPPAADPTRCPACDGQLVALVEQPQAPAHE